MPINYIVLRTNPEYQYDDVLNTINNNFSSVTTSFLSTSGGTIIGDLIVSGSISGGTFYGDGSNLSGVSSANYYTTASTLVGQTVFFDRNDQLSAYTLDLSSLVSSGGTDYYVTGATFNKLSSELTLSRNDGGIVTATGLTDFYTTGGTLIGTVIYFDRNDMSSAYSIELSGLTSGITFSGNYLPLSGGTVSGNSSFDSISATTLTATTIFSAGTELSLLFVQPNNIQTLTNKRITKRIVSVASSATPAFNTDNGDIARLTGLTTNITNASTNLTGTPNHGDMFSYEITDNGVARTISWGTSFAATGTLALPTTTVISTRLRCLFQYADNVLKWEIVAVV